MTEVNKEDAKYLKEVYGITNPYLENKNIYGTKKITFSYVLGQITNKLLGVRAAYYLKLYLFDLKAMKKALTEEKNKPQLQFPKKVAIIGVMTSKYVKYFPKYYDTIKKYFLPNTEKHFYCFSDQLDFPYFKNKDVTVVPTRHLPMPWTMLLTFHHMNRIVKELKKYSHVVYVDTDMYFQVPVLEQEFFNFKEPLFAVQHHAYVNKLGEFDFSGKSSASVKKSEDLSNYWLASFYGGKQKEMIEMIKSIKNQVNIDINNNIVARYVDESHLNRYLITHKKQVHTVSPTYSYPSLKPIPSPFKKKVVHITKTSNILGFIK